MSPECVLLLECVKFIILGGSESESSEDQSYTDSSEVCIFK